MHLSIGLLRIILILKKLMALYRIIIVTILILFMSELQSQGRLDPLVLKCVVNIDEKGSGFLVRKEITSGHGGEKLILITNKHMIGKWSLIEPFQPNQAITAYLYSNDPNSPVTPILIPISDKSGNLSPDVIIHPDPKIDIVAINISKEVNGASNLNLMRFDPSFITPIDSIAERAASGIGDQVFALGYPAGITSKHSNEPIVKTGIISSSLSGDLEVYLPYKVKDDKGNDKIIHAKPSGKYFLVDGLIIGGNSGGPVVSPKEAKFRVKDGRFQHTKGEVDNLILGIVSMGLPGTGISVIYSCDHIFDVLNLH